MRRRGSIPRRRRSAPRRSRWGGGSAGRKGWTLVEGTAAWADPAGLVNRTTYESLRDEILGQLGAALPVDAVVLGLHGAMVAAGTTIRRAIFSRASAG